MRKQSVVIPLLLLSACSEAGPGQLYPAPADAEPPPSSLDGSLRPDDAAQRLEDARSRPDVTTDAPFLRDGSPDVRPDAVRDSGPDISIHDAGTSSFEVRADFGVQQGPIRDLFGVNKAPSFSDVRGGGNTYDIAELWKGFGVSQARIHDVGIDLCEIYTDATIEDLASGSPVPASSCTAVTSSGPPHLRWTPKSLAAVDNIANYKFSGLDKVLAQIAASGAAPYVRLGHNYNGANDTSDPDAWAKVAANIYKYILGSFGTNPSPTIPAYVEVFNEPDGLFWVGDKTAFFTLFRNTVDYVRTAAAAANATTRVGGPGFTNEYLRKAKVSTNSANGFIQAVTPGRLDFFSVHRYDTCSTASLASSQTFLASVRAEVDIDAPHKPLHITEWNIGLGQQCGENFYSNARVQSYASGFLTLMQNDAYGIDAAHFYSGSVPMGLFSADSKTVGTVYIRPSAWALWAHARLRGGTKVSTEVCDVTTCSSGLATDRGLMALGGVANTGARYVIVSNDSDQAASYTLHVSGAGQSTKLVSWTPPSTALAVPAAGGGSSYAVSGAEAQKAMGAVSRADVSIQSTAAGYAATLGLSARSIHLLEL